MLKISRIYLHILGGSNEKKIDGSRFRPYGILTACGGSQATEGSVEETQVEESQVGSSEETTEETSEESSQASGEYEFEAGTYTAEAEGNNGPIVVEVTFSDSAIESVEVLEHWETAGISDAAINELPEEIVDTQSVDVDVKTGATNSSRAIKYAVADTIAQAGGEDHPLLDVDLDRPSEAEKWFMAEAEKIEKPEAIDGLIEVGTYDELEKALGYHEYIVNEETVEGKFMQIEGSAADGDTIRLTADLLAEGDEDNPKNADGSDKADVITGATVNVTKDVIIDGNGFTIDGDGYPTFLFAGQLEGYTDEKTEASVTNITIENGQYTAKIGGAIFVVGDATLNLEDSSIINSTAGSEKLLFNGGGAVYLNSHGLEPEVGRAVLNATNCTFTGNQTLNGGGGALMALNSDINLSGCSLSENTANVENGVGGAIALRGDSNLNVEDTEITNNQASVAGGGVYIFDGESLFKGEGTLMNAASATFGQGATVTDNSAEVAEDVCFGRYYPEGYEGDPARQGLEVAEEAEIGDVQDLTFTSIERNEVAK